ncbi:MAG: mediator of RNA polymerase II transcription subunit 9 [Betaproteobacteria bacterium]|nr:mediator of RNA polymerase II transcription subunit 9 [Betaproteobacteria bacterium]
MPIARFTLKWKRLWQRFGVHAPKVAIHTHLSWYWRLLIACVALSIVVGLALWGYDERFGAQALKRLTATQEIEALQHHVGELEAELVRMRIQSDTVASNAQIDRTVQEQLLESIKNLEQENASLKQDLAFFEGLVPEAGVTGSGLRIERLQIEPEGSGGRYRYKMLLVYNDGKKSGEFRGNLQLVVKVQEKGKDATISFPATNSADAQRFRISIRHFQRAEGFFSVPSGSVVKNVEVRLLQEGVVRARQTLNL